MPAFQLGPNTFQKQFTSNPFPQIPTFLSYRYITIISQGILKVTYKALSFIMIISVKEM